MTVRPLVAQEAYAALPAPYQQALRTACGETFCDRIAAYGAANPAALRRLVDEHGASVQRYSGNIMEAAWPESHAYLDEFAAANPEFGRLYASHPAFRLDACAARVGAEARKPAAIAAVHISFYGVFSKLCMSPVRRGAAAPHGARQARPA